VLWHQGFPAEAPEPPPRCRHPVAATDLAEEAWRSGSEGEHLTVDALARELIDLPFDKDASDGIPRTWIVRGDVEHAKRHVGSPRKREVAMVLLLARGSERPMAGC
jgi:hypothetical protein